jgi:peptidoglycan/LPS O-acetylase OafA/YrhL
MLSTAKTHIHEIDGLRGIAILCVMIYHLVISPFTPSFGFAINNVLALFAYGVDLFFVISGFLIGTILLKITSFSGIFTFYFRRILRIWPLYYLLLLLVYLALPQKSLFSQAPYWSFLFFIFNFWESYGKMSHQALGPLWSIAIEEQFYVLAPLVFSILNRKQISILLIGYIVFSPLLRLGFLLYHMDVDPWRFTPTRMDGICIGLLLSLLCSSDGTFQFMAKRIKHLLVLTFLLLGSIIPAVLLLPDHLWVSFGRSLIALSFGFVLLTVLVRSSLGKDIRFLNLGFLRYLGLRCYSIYLFHIFFSLIINGLFDVFYIALIVELIMILLFAQLSWKYIEMPFIRFGRKFSYKETL